MSHSKREWEVGSAIELLALTSSKENPQKQKENAISITYRQIPMG
jgi:hypothetical protein